MPTFVIRPSSAEPFPPSPQSSGRSLPSFSSGFSKEDSDLFSFYFKKCIDNKKMRLHMNRAKMKLRKGDFITLTAGSARLSEQRQTRIIFWISSFKMACPGRVLNE
jgi:hypothetical protein